MTNPQRSGPNYATSIEQNMQKSIITNAMKQKPIPFRSRVIFPRRLDGQNRSNQQQVDKIRAYKGHN